MPDWTDDEIVLISAIEHYSYCPRQCALIHIEKVFDENVFTLRGRKAHERVDEPEAALAEGMTVERALPLWSNSLGLQGKADVVQFHPDGPIYPVEYKHGRRRAKEHDDLQLCAQALCLEEMLDCMISKGAIYYHSSHHRREVHFDDELRAKTTKIIQDIRRMQIKGEIPPPLNDARCTHCSLHDACMPEALDLISNPNIRDRLFEPVGEEDIHE